MTEFVTESRRWIASLGADVSSFIEPRSGMRHLHLHDGGDQRVFMLAFPTRPASSDGRAHILEHVVLCGSERFPVADPFFAMTRRSLASFMNAMTGPDCTVYPFATRDATDFDNLLDVYLDAAYFPRLERLSFLQEGWRLVLDGEELDLQGVVLNEMKGVEGDPMTPLQRAIRRQLLEGTTYAHDHGGDSRAIPTLTHAALREFHATHYHPSQTLVLTAGPVDPSRTQATLVDRVLKRFETMPQASSAGPSGLATPWHVPRRQRVEVPAGGADAEGAGEAEHGVYLSWRLGDALDSTERARAMLLQAALLGADSAPLVRAMESSGYGRPGRLNGIDDGSRQWLLHIGMEGLEEHEVDAAEARILSALQAVAERGLPAEELETVIDELRLALREPPADDMPEAMARLLQVTPLVMRGADPAAALDGEAAIDALHSELKQPGAFRRMVSSLLADPACVVTHQVPVPDYFERLRHQETEWLRDRQRQLDKAARIEIEADARALHERQAQGSDPNILPRLRSTHIDAEPTPLPRLQAAESGAWLAPQAGSRLSHAELIHDASAFDESQWPWLALYAGVLTSCGAAGRRSAEAAAWRRRHVPRLWAEVVGVSLADRSLRPALHLCATSLSERAAALPEVLRAWSQAPLFDEPERLGFAVQSWVEQRLSGLPMESDSHARHAAAAPLSAVGFFRDRIDGVGSLRFCFALRDMLESPAGLARIAQRLTEVHRTLTAKPAQALCAGAEGALPGLAEALSQSMPIESAKSLTQTGGWRFTTALLPAGLALPSGMEVNHCAAAWPAPDAGPDDTAVLAVAAALMTDMTLHRNVRERGGAYGVMAGWSSDEHLFMMQSYRDPRLGETFADFEAAIDALGGNLAHADQVDEAIVSVIRQSDGARSPAARLREAWALRHRGVDDEARRRWRATVLQCTPGQVRDAVRKWLQPCRPSLAAAVADGRADVAGLVPVDLDNITTTHYA